MSSKKKQNKNIINKNKIKKDKENLNKMLKDYQNFCQKFFGNSTLISSMERMNQIIEEENFEENDEENEKNNNNNNNNKNFIKNNSIDDKESSLTMIKNDDYDFCFNVSFDTNFENFIKLSNKNFLGFEKNDKNDYERRLKKISKKNNEKNSKKKTNEKINEKKNIQNENSLENEYNDFENEENENFFDENTNKLINEIHKTEQATKIQIYFKSQKCPKRNKDKIFFGFDKTKKFIIWIFIDKISNFKNKDAIIFSLAFKIYSFETKILTYEKYKIKDLLMIDSINKNKINEKIDTIINKVLKEKKNKNNNNKNKENSFEDFDINKNNKNNNSIENYNDFKDSISSIENVEYENI